MPKRIRKPLYGVYTQMIARCNSETHPWYSNYGGRGIKVCERWVGKDGYDNFIADMGTRPEKTSLDRIDNEKGYSPENCRWSSYTVQSINQRKGAKNKSGVIGVFWNTQRERWQAKIEFMGEVKHLGFYHSLDDAKMARLQGEAIYHKPLLEVVR